MKTVKTVERREFICFRSCGLHRHYQFIPRKRNVVRYKPLLLLMQCINDLPLARSSCCHAIITLQSYLAASPCVDLLRSHCDPTEGRKYKITEKSVLDQNKAKSREF